MTHNPRFLPGATAASVTTASAGGVLSVYDGIQPAGPSTPVSTQRLLATVQLPAFKAPVITSTNYSASTGPLTPVKAVQSGIATWFRVTNAASAPVFDGSAGTDTCDLTLAPNAFLEAGANVTISGLIVSGQASQDVTGAVGVTVPVPGTTPPVAVLPVAVASGYTGTEPAFAGAISWCGYNWEPQNWGANGSGWPVAGQVSVDSNGYLNLRCTTVGGKLLGAEVDSVRGDLGITPNQSRWGYGRYRWVIGTDMSTVDPSVVLGLFTFSAYGSPTSVPANPNGKGGPPGNKEIDIEISNWQPEGNRAPGTFYGLGFYQDDGHGVTSGVPATWGQSCHTMTPGSQQLVPAGHPVSTLEFTWMPDHITWNVWYSDITKLAVHPVPDYQLTMTEGETYDYTEMFGGNHFAGTVHIPAAGAHQVIMNLWAQGQATVQDTTVIIRSFSYTASDA